jgi:hypothetical protein
MPGTNHHLEFGGTPPGICLEKNYELNSKIFVGEINPKGRRY